MQYEKNAPTRDVTLLNFANGPIHFKWENSGQKWFLPSRVHTRTRLQISDDAGNPIDLADDVAPNMGLMAHLFQSMEFRINDKTVSRISDFCPQIDALESRTSKSSAWLESIGASVNFWQDDFKERQAEIASDGYLSPYAQSVQAGVTELTWEDLGLPGTVSAEWAANVLTFAGVGAVNTNQIFRVGDLVSFSSINGVASSAAPTGVRFRITTIGAVLTSATEAVDAGMLPVVADVTNRIVILRNMAAAPDNDARRAGLVELSWQPPLSIFKVGNAMPAGKYELILTPQNANVYPIRAIQSQLTAKVPFGTAGANFKVSVVDMYLYVPTVEGPRADNITYLLDLEQTRCQAEKIDSDSFGQKSFDVSPSSYALTVAYQDIRAGTDSRISSSLFRAYGALVNGTVPAPLELALNRMYVNYAGQNMPDSDADPLFLAGTDYTTQRYIESQMNTGSYFDSGGAETIQEYHKRGSYYYFSWPKDGTDRSTRVTVHQGFTPGTVVTNFRVLLFDHSKQVCRVRVADGRVQDVQLEDA